MSLDVRHQWTVLERMSVPELQARYAQLFGEAPPSRNKQSLVRRILWRLQAQAEGDLSERARRRAAELADDSQLRLSPPSKASPAPVILPLADRRLPAPGTVLTRRYKGRLLEVTVLEQGFAYDGQPFRSLSAVAKHITGSHVNGYLFFGLVEKGRRNQA